MTAVLAASSTAITLDHPHAAVYAQDKEADGLPASNDDHALGGYGNNENTDESCQNAEDPHACFDMKVETVLGGLVDEVDQHLEDCLDTAEYLKNQILEERRKLRSERESELDGIFTDV